LVNPLIEETLSLAPGKDKMLILRGSDKEVCARASKVVNERLMAGS
jgi:hypothetical protein